MKTRVVNCRDEPCDIYIGRPSVWGNPFAHVKSRHAVYEAPDRATAIAKYEEWLRGQSVLLDNLRNLKGKTLGCWCKPLPCHGDVIVKLIEELCP